MAQECVVARHINGITLNGFEFLINDAGTLKVFENKKAAVKFLKDNDITDEELECFRFFNYQELQKGIYEEIS